MSDIQQLSTKYASETRTASAYDKVYKDECAYSYDTAESPVEGAGLYVCLKTFVAVSRQYLDVHARKTDSHLYLRIKTHRKRVVQTDKDDDNEPEKKKSTAAPTKLALGVEGGFDLNEKQFYFDTDYWLYVHPEGVEVKLNAEGWAEGVDERVIKSAQSVIKADSAAMKEELACQAAAWDGEKRFVSKHAASLVQLPSPPQISPNPASWKCEICGLTSNLWLNLTDGTILCGRRQLDGSGGNNHAVEHYAKTKHPLAVKMGTITATQADVYSYDEDDMVEDPNLAVHLSHFGINMSKMEKTEKTMAELEIDLNQRVGEWDRIQESGSKLVPAYGAGFTGLRNLGNSCYMNSVVQMLFSLPEFAKKFVESREAYVRNSTSEPSGNFNFQLSKLGYGLLSGRYSHNEDDKPLDESSPLVKPPKGIKPTSFKSIVGRGHPEFASKRQQDAQEFLIYLFGLIEKNARTAEAGAVPNPVDAFRFQLQDRFECSQSHQVKYKTRPDVCLSVPISRDLALNKEAVAAFEKRKAELKEKGARLEPGDIVRPEIRLEDCIRLLTQQDVVSDFYSSAVKSKVDALKTTRIASFPDYLLIHAKKFEFAPDWTPIKLDVSLQVPDTLDLKEFRAVPGPQPGEVEMKDEEDAVAAQVPEIKLNEDIIGQLMDMGFSLDGSQRAVYNTRETNNVETAVNWAMSHMEDADFNSPFQLPKPQKPATSAAKPAAAAGSKTYDEEAINSIVSFGFTRQQAMKALDATGNNLERAADWVFTHPDELMEVDEPAATATTAATSTAAAAATGGFHDGSERYKLIGFVSHMGTNANVGHYVAHLLKDDRWVIFNDENVALSENPPKDLAYLYLYKRV